MKQPSFNVYIDHRNGLKNMSWINGLSLEDIPLYHILSTEHLISMVKNKRLHFCNILDSWEDPYELSFFKNKFIMANYGGVTLNTDDVTKLHYGQCWTKKKDSDAMWRIYSQNKTGVRIKTSLSKIYDLIFNHNNPSMNNSMAKMGFVDYFNQKAFGAWLSNPSKMDFITCSEKMEESLFIKRNNFSHEQEFRIIYTMPTQQGLKPIANIPPYLEIPFDPFTFIEEIALDPRLSIGEFAIDIAHLRKEIGSKIPIIQSPLYRFHTSTIYIS